jgi:glucose-6-phosphate dehydrogenase assembly protein OpcA
MPVLSDAVWSAEGTTPDAIEAALRRLLSEAHAENGVLVPARVLNMVVFVESDRSGEIASRLRGVGRYHASRTVVLSYRRSRERLSARVSVAAEGEPGPDEPALLRETAVVEIGERHLDDLPTIADPLVITDLPTLLWSPHRHHREADALLGLAQATLIDSVEEPDWHGAIERACALSERAYVVDLAWLRSTPWRERVAATFDPARMRPELHGLRSLTIRHHPHSTVAAMLFVGWLASRLGWELRHARIEGRADADAVLVGIAHAGETKIELRLQVAPELSVPGLAGVHLSTGSGLRLSLDRGPGGLHEQRCQPAAGAPTGREETVERAWTLLGASRGEGGILGEGIRQALLRDPTYLPALHAARSMLPETGTETGTDTARTRTRTQAETDTAKAETTEGARTMKTTVGTDSAGTEGARR